MENFLQFYIPLTLMGARVFLLFVTHVCNTQNVQADMFYHTLYKYFHDFWSDDRILVYDLQI